MEFTKWVTMWGNAQSMNMPLAQQYAKNVTLRYPIFTPFNGNMIRINLDNFCIDEDINIEGVTVGIGDKLSDKVTDIRNVCFKGMRNVTIKAHENVYSDELPIEVLQNQFLVISIYLKDYVNLSGGVDIEGPLAKGYFSYGNELYSETLDINKSKSTTWIYFLANIDILTEEKNEAVICYGDSITSGAWPDYMLFSLRDRGINNVSIIRKAVPGTRILREYSCITYRSYGLKGENRFMHEVSSVKGAKKIIIQHGINDIIHPVGEWVNVFRPMSDLPTVEELIGGLNYYIDSAKKLNLDVYVGTLLPIFNWRTYAPFREQLKNEYNKYIRGLDKCIDFENEIGFIDKDIYKFKDNCDSGDHLHPSSYAYDLMGKCAANYIDWREENE